MPAALDVDREQVRMLVVSVGCREAARQMDLPEPTVQAWSARYGWLKDLPRSQPLPPTMVKARATNATTAPEAQRNIIVEKLLETRENYLDTSLATSRKVKQTPVEEWLTKEGSQTLLANVKVASLVGGWGADSRPDAPAKAFGGRNTGLVVDAEVIEISDISESGNAEISQISTNVDDY